MPSKQLENRIKPGVIVSESQRITSQDLELTSPYIRYEGRGLREAREALERDLIREPLTWNKENIARAAEELRVSRPTVYELMEKLEVEKKNKNIGIME